MKKTIGWPAFSLDVFIRLLFMENYEFLPKNIAICIVYFTSYLTYHTVYISKCNNLQPSEPQKINKLI